MANKGFRLTVFWKMALPVIISQIVLVLFVLFFILPKIENNMYNQKDEFVKNIVETVYTHIDSLQRAQAQGKITNEQFLSDVRSIIKSTRFEGNNYLYMFDKDTIIIHPTNESLNGKTIDYLKDAQDQSIFLKKIIDKLNTSKEAFQKYYWTKPDVSGFYAKQTYSKKFERNGWVLCAGIYIDDVEKEISSLNNTILIAFIALSILMLLFITFITVKSIARPLNKLQKLSESISQGNLNMNLEHRSKDEIGDLFGSFKIMSNTIKKLVSEIGGLTEAASLGKLDFRGDSVQFKGVYSDVVVGINQTLDAVIGPLNIAAEYVDRISKGDIPPKITDDFKGDFNEIKNNLNQCIDAVDLLVKDASMLAKSADEGKLDTRADALRHQGEFRSIINGVNNTLDNVIRPLNIAAEYVDRISKGDIPPLITDKMNGDFNEIKNNINKLIETVNLIMFGIDRVSTKIKNGDLSDRGKADAWSGDWKKLVQGIIDIINTLYEPLSLASGFIAKVSQGADLEPITEEYKGDYNILKNNINTSRDVLYGMIGDVQVLTKAAIDGKLDVRADLTKYSGGWKIIVGGFNDTLDAVIRPLNIAAEYMDRISKGDIPPIITDTMNGDFNEIKNNINKLIENISLILRAVDRISNHIQIGDLKDRCNVNLFTGDWKNLVLGINAIIDAMYAPLMLTSEYIDIISKGEIPSVITDEYKGDFNIIKNNINACVDGLGALVDSNRVLGLMVINDNTEKVEGNHNGIFADIATSVNVIRKKIIEITKICTEISKGDLSALDLLKQEGKRCDNDELNPAFINMMDALQNLVNETIVLSKAGTEGKLDIRGNTDKYQGQFKHVVEGINNTLDSVIGPLNVAAEYIDRISKGDIPEKINEKYHGDFNEIKNNINQCIEAISTLVSDVNMLSNAAVIGKLDVRADENKHQGDFAKIMAGFNKTIDSIINPIIEAAEVLSIMATGDLTPRITEDYQGEHQKLKKNINSLGDSLGNLINTVGGLAITVSQISTEISSAAETMAAGATEQSAQADDVASAVEEMARTITENAMGANKTATVAETNRKIASEGGSIVHQTVEKMRDISNVVKTSATNIGKLGTSSQQIGEIISVIDDIADQTNLLALNAAIEAARAGDQGRGFAVVADEVRKLAERTTDATKQIAKMIKGIQNDTSEAVMVMNKGTEEVNSGIKLADEAGNALKEIVDSSQEVFDMINLIAAASEEQSSTSEEIAKNVNAISQVTNDSAGKINQIASSAEELNKLTEQLAESLEQFKVDNTPTSYGNTNAYPPVQSSLLSKKKNLLMTSRR